MTHPHREVISVVPEPDEAAAALGELDDFLWRERAMLERLHLRLLSQASFVARAEWRWLPISDLDVRDAITALQTSEIARAALSDELATRFGLPADSSLLSLQCVAGEPWAEILREHRCALRRSERQIRELAARTAHDVRVAFDLDEGEGDDSGWPVASVPGQDGEE